MHSTEWFEGSQAYHNEWDYDNNPYREGTGEYNDWRDGFLFTQEGWEN